MTKPSPERIGVIVVHGIGEQRRFEFLDARTRELIEALSGAADDCKVSVDIAGAAGAAFQAAQDTWSGGPKPSVELHLTSKGESKLIGIHEVWWADVNEPDSLGKQVRFWLWGLGVWLYPKRRRSTLSSADRVVPPRPEESEVCVRAKLYLVGSFFVLAGLSLGTVIGLFCRLFQLRRWEWLAVVGNYVSAVKLFNQRHRYDGSLWGKEHEFLDNIGQPPRVSVRRRMIRAIADVACSPYQRWYVLAHSQGTIVAFNGLMETGFAWPGYLDPERLERLRALDMAGPPVAGAPLPEGKRTMPPRPSWARDDIAYRRRIFKNFRGMLTFGSPLEKFAVIWPAIVPISREPAFSRGSIWINVMDPLDPVSGVLKSFAGKDIRYDNDPEICCPQVHNIGYVAGDLFLANHLTYLTPRKRPRSDLVGRVAGWLVDDDATAITARSEMDNRTWFSADPPDRRYYLRRGYAVLSWLVLAAVSAVIGMFVLPWALDLAWAALSGKEHLISWRARWLALGALVLAAVILPAIAGVVARLSTYRWEAYEIEGGPPGRDRRARAPRGSPPHGDRRTTCDADKWALAPQDPPP